jgi:prepilin-type N-terminal cleavage/methylation domain-containing protein
MRTGRKSQAGLTLIELMMAALVFAIGMVAVLGSLVGIMNNHRVAITKNKAYTEIQNQLVALEGTLNDSNVLSFDINNPAAIELPDLPGSSVTLFIINPDGVSGPELIELPDANAGTNFPGGPPDPFEIVMEALVPTGGGNNTFYRFRMSKLY